MEALNIFSYSKAIAAIEVVILFKISSSISIKKNYFDSLLISNAVLIEAEGLRIACLADYKYQPNKIYTLKSIKKKTYTTVREQSKRKIKRLFHG